MISTLEHNTSSTPLGQAITASQWVKIKPIGSIKAFIRVHHPFSLIFALISSPLQWIVDFCKVFKHTWYVQVLPVDLNAIHYCYSYSFFLLTAKIEYQPALPSQRRFLMQNMPVGHMIKFLITYQTVSGRHIYIYMFIYLYIRMLKDLKELSRNLQGVPGKRKLTKVINDALGCSLQVPEIILQSPWRLLLQKGHPWEKWEKEGFFSLYTLWKESKCWGK